MIVAHASRSSTEPVHLVAASNFTFIACFIFGCSFIYLLNEELIPINQRSVAFSAFNAEIVYDFLLLRWRDGGRDGISQICPHIASWISNTCGGLRQISRGETPILIRVDLTGKRFLKGRFKLHRLLHIFWRVAGIHFVVTTGDEQTSDERHCS